LLKLNKKNIIFISALGKPQQRNGKPNRNPHNFRSCWLSGKCCR